MNWNKLKENKCPQCSHDLTGVTVGSITMDKLIVCQNQCGFKISEKRMKEIVQSQIVKIIDLDKHYRPEDENPDY